MKKWWRAILGSSLWLYPSLVMAGGGKATHLKHLAEPEKAGNALFRWFAVLYNDNKLYYALVCIGLMVLMGGVLGYLTDLFLAKIGFETKKIEHME
jgi:hypothetical protein